MRNNNSTIMETTKEAIKILVGIVSNWRIDALTLLFALTLLLAMDDTDDIAMLVTTKIAAVVIGYLTAKLSKSWEKRGYLKELEIFNDDDEE